MRCLVGGWCGYPETSHGGLPAGSRRAAGGLVERGGEPGPIVRAMVNAATLLRGHLELTRAMKRTHLDRRIVERINLAVVVGTQRVAGAMACRAGTRPL
jgi:hypothetical protein